MATLLPLAEKLAHRALVRRGWSSVRYETPAGRVHAYEARGSGSLPTTVIVHGLSSNGLAFARTVMGVLPHVKRAIALELPGHGFSDEPSATLTPELLFASMTTAIDRIAHHEPIVLAGNSLGGAVALRYAIDRPAQVRALALFSPAGAKESREGLREVVSAFDPKGRRHALALLRRIYHKQPWFLPILALEMPDMLAKKAVRDIARTVDTHHAIEPHELAKIEMPVLLCWGRSEKLLPPRYLEYFRAHLPAHAKILEPHAMGHCPHFDDPAGVAEMIVALAREAR